MNNPVKQQYDIVDLLGLVWKGPRKFIWIVSLCLLCCCLWPWQCLNQVFEVGEEVVKRYPSPDGKFEVVLIETNGGATTPYGANLVLARSGQTPSFQSAFYRSTHYREYPKVRWLSNREVEVTEYGGKVFVKDSQAKIGSLVGSKKIAIEYK